jgi:hypothetical protein
MEYSGDVNLFNLEVEFEVEEFLLFHKAVFYFF